MKKQFIALLLVVMSIVYTVPAMGAQEQEKADSCVGQAVDTCSSSMITIAYTQLDEVIKDKMGIPMLTVQGNTPTVTIGAHKKVSSRINAFYKKKVKELKVQEKEYTKMAGEDYNQRTQDEKKYWEGYGLGRTYSQGRVDEKVMSIIENNYEYTGGAHPNATRVAQTFSTQTGKQLTLGDVLTDEAKADEFINGFILQETKKYEYKDYFFEDYQQHIKELLTENTWYLSDEGFVIISNEYIISPHVVGILEFTIPYDQFQYLKPEYRPQ